MLLQEAKINWKISEELSNNLAHLGITSFFPVQSSVIPFLLTSNQNPALVSRDICVSSSTGSGKTLAFVVPIVQILLREPIVPIVLRSLIIVPTRELANQIHYVALACTKGTKVLVGISVGSGTIEDERQSLLTHSSISTSDCDFYRISPQKSRSKVHILVGTPGRLLEHIEHSDGLSLNHLKFLVLDEADRLLSNASHFWIRTLLNQENSSIRLQKWLFSATLSDNPAMLHLLGIRNPLIFNVDKLSLAVQSSSAKPSSHVLPASLKEYICISESNVKLLHLVALLRDAIHEGSDVHGCLSDSNAMCMVFASSTETAQRLFKVLENINNMQQDGTLYFGGKIGQMSSALSSSERTGLMQAIACSQNDANEEGVKILVCSDQMARGLDMSNVTLVINYDPPSAGKTYVHRVGRTARANRIGYCVTMLKSGGQVGSFRKMRCELEEEALGVAVTGKRKLADESGIALLVKSLLAKYQPASEVVLSITSLYKDAVKMLDN